MKSIIKIVAVVFLIGGVMGLIKGIFPQLEWLSFRSLFGAGPGYHPASVYIAERVYGIVMAALEVLMAVLMLISLAKYSFMALLVVGINALGCVAAVIMGDMFAIVSLLLRAAVIVLLVCVIRREKAVNRQSTGAIGVEE